MVSHERCSVIPELFLAVPLTSVFRRLRHHVEVPADDTTRLARTSYAMTEQVRALSHARIDRGIGATDAATLAAISRYVHMFIV